MTVGRRIFLDVALAEMDGSFSRYFLANAWRLARAFFLDFCFENFPAGGFLDNPVLKAGWLDTQPTAIRRVRLIARNDLNVFLNPLQLRRQTFF